MRKTIYLFFISFFWGCLQEDSPPEVLSPGSQQRHGLALLFQQKLEKLPVSRTSKTEANSEHGTPLLEHVRVGHNAIYGGLYFIVPLQNSRGQIDAGLVYPLMGNDTISGFDLSGDLGTPSVVDEHVINEVSDRGQRFLLSNKFLAWKKEGLAVASGLYAYAESLDGKHVYRPNPNRVRSKSSTSNLIAEVFIDYEIDPNDEVVYPSPDGGVIATFLYEEDINQIFSDALSIFSSTWGVWSYDFRGASFNHAYLILEVDDESVIADAINEYINEVASLFDDRFCVSDIPFYFHYFVNESSPGPSPDPGEGGDVGGSNVGEGEGGGTADGEDEETPHVCPYGKCSGNPCTCCAKCQGPCTGPKCPVCQTEHCTNPAHLDCDSVSVVSKQLVLNRYDTIVNHVDTSYKRPAWEDFLDTINANPRIEHATSLTFYDGKYYQLKSINSGDADSVKMDCDVYTLTMIHSHPTQKAVPPSPRDVYSTMQSNKKFPKMKIMYVYVNGDMYALRVQDTAKASAFLRDTAIRIGADGDFAEGTKIQEDFKHSINNDFSGMTNVEKHAFALARILEQYNAGVQLFRKKSSETGFSVLKTKKGETGKYTATECK